MKKFFVYLLLMICFSPLNTFGGECVKGDCLNGWGTYTYSDGSKYEGQWKDSRFHGQGIYTFPDGGRYIGQMRYGERNGQGIMFQSDGGKYVGEWRNSDMDGYGTYTYPDGSKYEGQWKDGQYHGRGSYTYNDKDPRFKHVGRFNYGKKHGYRTGTMSYKNGCKFVGHWKDDKPHGIGTMIYPDGTKLLGEIKDGEFVEEQQKDESKEGREE